MISLDNLRTVLNAIKRTLDSTKQDKLIAGKNINIAEDGKTISATQVIEVALAEQPDGNYTADITFAQLKAEVASGKQLMLVKDESRVFVLNAANDSAIEFLGADVLGVSYAKITATVNEVWNVEGALTPNTDNISKIFSDIGLLANLTTDDKTHLVAAINEVNNNTDLALGRIDYDRSTKQDKLIAGENITIAADGKTISATAGGGPTVELDTTLSKAGKAADAKAVGDALTGKQDTISDLATIRSGASKGATALQSVPNTYRTAAAQDKIDNKKVDKVAGKGLSTNDYTNAAKAKVDAIPANPKYTDTVYNDTAVKNRLTALENKDDAPLTPTSSRIKNVSYTAKYIQLLGAVLVRIYCTINTDMNVGYDYDIMTIDGYLPNSTTALAVKCSKQAMAIAKRGDGAGAIQIRPLESNINGYDVWITGFWFV